MTFKNNVVPMALLNVFDMFFYHNTMPNGILTLNSHNYGDLRTLKDFVNLSLLEFNRQLTIEYRTQLAEL